MRTKEGQGFLTFAITGICALFVCAQLRLHRGASAEVRYGAADFLGFFSGQLSYRKVQEEFLA